jgi:hypothetical protein
MVPPDPPNGGVGAKKRLCELSQCDFGSGVGNGGRSMGDLPSYGLIRSDPYLHILSRTLLFTNSRVPRIHKWDSERYCGHSYLPASGLP